MERSFIWVAIVTLLTAGHAHAESWRAITGDSESATFLELDGRAKTAEGVRIWTVKALAQPYGPMMGIFGKDVQVERVLYEIDCTGGRIRSLQTSYMTKALNSRGEMNPPSPRWSYIAPGTVGETIQKVACDAKEPPPLGPSQTSMSGAVTDYLAWLSRH